MLKYAGVARSTSYYQLKRMKTKDKHETVKEDILKIYHENKGRYGYRRITLALRHLGYFINHKKVQRLMGCLGIKSLVRIKKYRSYRGEIGRIAPNSSKKRV